MNAAADRTDEPVRFPMWTVVCATLLAAMVRAAGAQETGPLSIRADRIAFYSDRFLVEADGNVTVRLADGRLVTGSTCAVDLHAHRMVVAGGVHLHTAKNDWDGAAYSEFFDFRRAYFLPITDKPDRWTFVNAQFDAPLKGRVMPGDAFALADVPATGALVYAKWARVTFRENVTFGAGRVRTGFVYVPVPRYVFNYSENSNFAQNSLAGAYFDVPYAFAGSKNALSAFHLRYDLVNRAYLSFEQHFVTDRDFVVASINPMTRPQKYWTVIASEQLGSRMQQQTQYRLQTFQSGLSSPLSASSWFDTRSTYALRQSSISLEFQQYNNSLLAQPQPDANGAYYYGDPSHSWDPNHQFQAALGWSGVDERFLKTPIHYTLNSGVNWTYNNLGVQTFNNKVYTTFWTGFAGVTASLPSLKLGPVWTLNASASKQRSWYSAPHYVDQTSTTASVSRQFGTKASLGTYYSINNYVDNYGALQLIAYPPVAVYSTWDNQYHYDYGAFRGLWTARQVAERFNYSPSPLFSAQFSFSYDRDFPTPIPEAVGNPPFQFFADVRYRFTKTLYLDVNRWYYFNWGTQGWTPQFNVSVGT